MPLRTAIVFTTMHMYFFPFSILRPVFTLQFFPFSPNPSTINLTIGHTLIIPSMESTSSHTIQTVHLCGFFPLPTKHMVGLAKMILVPLVLSWQKEKTEKWPSAVSLAMMRRGVVPVMNTTTTSLPTLKQISKVDEFEGD